MRSSRTPSRRRCDEHSKPAWKKLANLLPVGSLMDVTNARKSKWSRSDHLTERPTRSTLAQSPSSCFEWREEVSIVRQNWPERLWLVRHGQSQGNVARDAAHEAGAHEIDIDMRDVDVPLSA